MTAQDREADARDYAEAETARQLGLSNRDDANTKGPRMRTIYLTAATLLTAALLTACGTTTNTPTPAAGTNPAPTTSGDMADHTRQVWTITWGGTTEPQRNNLCAGVYLLGHDATAAEMQKGADGSTNLDWSLMADLLAAECDNR